MDLAAPLLASPAAPKIPSATGGPANLEAIHTAAQNFESYFLQQSFESMFEGTGDDDLFGGGEGESIYRSLLIQEYAKAAAQHGGIGIAAAVQNEMLRLQEKK